jgi:predicted TIM-barrel fold metal-dependent hydrolase
MCYNLYQCGGTWGDSPGKGECGRLERNGLRSTDIPSTMGRVLGLVIDQMVTSVLERPEQRHGREEAMPFPRLSDVPVTQETLATIDCEPRISGDSHMTEPPDLWEKRLPAALRDRAPRFPQRDNASSGRVRAGGWDPYERLKDQAYDSISAEVLYPTRGNAAWVTGDPELEEACCRVYNDWMIEFCSAAPQRLWGLAMISLWNIEHAVQELERCRKAGLRGAAIGLVPAEELLYGSDHYERFWAACQDLAMPVNMHINSGPGRLHFSPQQRSGLMPDGAMGHKWDCMKAVGNIIAAGVFERYPGLNLVVAEAGVGWIPFFAQEFDYYQVSFGPSGSGLGRQRDLPQPPSEYIYRQVYGVFIQDTVGCKLLPEYGLDTFMWSNDYPHSACIWPGATRFIAQDLGHLTPEARTRVLCGNAVRLYNDGQLPPPPEPAGEVKDLEAWNKVHWGE